MKTLNQKIAAVFIILSLYSSFSYGQCKNFIKKVDMSVLKSYESCDNQRVAEMYQGDEAVIFEEIKSANRYRLYLPADQHLGELSLSISNKQNDTLGSMVNKGDQKYWDLMVQSDQVVKIRIKVSDELNKTRIDAPGCVALLIGKMSNEELVSTGD